MAYTSGYYEAYWTGARSVVGVQKTRVLRRARHFSLPQQAYAEIARMVANGELPRSALRLRVGRRAPVNTERSQRRPGEWRTRKGPLWDHWRNTKT